MQNYNELEILAEGVTAITRFNILLERMSQADFYKLPDVNMTYLPNYYFVWISNSKGKMSIDPSKGLIPAHMPGAEQKALDLAKKYQSQGRSVEIHLKGKPIKKFKGTPKAPKPETEEPLASQEKPKEIQPATATNNPSVPQKPVPMTFGAQAQRDLNGIF